MLIVTYGDFGYTGRAKYLPGLMSCPAAEDGSYDFYVNDVVRIDVVRVFLEYDEIRELSRRQ